MELFTKYFLFLLFVTLSVSNENATTVNETTEATTQETTSLGITSTMTLSSLSSNGTNSSVKATTTEEQMEPNAALFWGLFGGLAAGALITFTGMVLFGLKIAKGYKELNAKPAASKSTSTTKDDSCSSRASPATDKSKKDSMKSSVRDSNSSRR